MPTAKQYGKRGGNSTLQKYGPKHYSKIAKEAWAKRNEILKNFTVGEIANPITSASVADALEEIDKTNV